MPFKKIHNKLEHLINSLIIKENQKSFIQKKINEFYNELKNITQYQMPSWSNIYLSSSEYTFERFWYGNSFDKCIFIKNRYDIDLYFVYFKSNSQNTHEREKITREFLFELIYSNLKSFHYYHGTDMKILKDPPYGYAIPIRMDYPAISILFDCIPAIELPIGYLVIPNLLGGIRKVNPNLEEQALSKLSLKQNGKVIKLIILIKYWNFTWGKPINGFILECLTEYIFDKIEINRWDQAIQTFYNQAINILSEKINIADKTHSLYSILNEYSSSELDNYLEIFNEAAIYAQKKIWKEIFDEF
ncbi:MAG: hypothetical protein ACFFDF_06945 [Candidatus Odinarchaeota archaeon]